MLPVPLQRFIQAAGRNTVELREIGIEQDLLPTDEQDAAFDRKGGQFGRRNRAYELTNSVRRLKIKSEQKTNQNR
jgi:hypothetical protein